MARTRAKSDEDAGQGEALSKDARALKQTRSRLRTAEYRIEALLTSAGQGVSLYDRNQRLVYCNQAFLEVYRLPASVGKRGTSFREILEARVRSNTHVGADGEAYVTDRITSVREPRVKGFMRHLNSGQVVALAHYPMADGGWVSTHRDVTEHNNMQAELARLAYHDQLTGLPNRAMFYRKMATATHQLEHGRGFSVLCLDLDNFKPVNDLMGHAAGDALLRSFSERLGSIAGPRACAARMGGDEFAVLLMDASAATALRVADEIIAATQAPFEIDGQKVMISTAIGIALAPEHGSTADTIMKAADQALYAAKRRKDGGALVYAPEISTEVRAEQDHLRELQLALERGDFELHYQPVINVRTAQLSGFEALLRWKHPEKGMILPSEFIPLAERSEMIVQIGEWVMRQAIAEAAQWPEPLRVAVNVSPFQLTKGDLPGVVVDALQHAGLPAARLEIEITESAFLGDVENTKTKLRALHEAGAKLALDDFGSGYSVLGSLMDFPFDRVKLDRSLVHALGKSQAAPTIIGAVAKICAELDVACTAEGIETLEQLRAVHAAGFDEVQGFLMARPMPRDAVRQLLAESFDVMPEAPMVELMQQDLAQEELARSAG